MSENNKEEVKRFLEWLPTQRWGNLLHNILNVTTKVTYPDPDNPDNILIAGFIEENVLLQDAELRVIDPLFFFETEYYLWAIEKHERSMERVEKRLKLSTELGQRLISLLSKFIALGV